MAVRVVARLEPVHVNEQHAQRLPVALRQRNGLRQPVIEQEAIREPGQRIVLRQMSHLPRGLACGADIAKHNHRADESSCPIANGRRRILDGAFMAVAPYENAVRCQADRLVQLQGKRQWVWGDLGACRCR